MGVAVSSSHVVSATLNSSHSSPAPGWGTSYGRQSSTGLLSPRVHRSCWKPAPVRAIHRITASFRHPPALAWGPPRAAGGNLLHCGPEWAAGRQPASPWSAPWAAGEPLLRCLEHLLPSFCTYLGVCRVVSLTYSRSSHLSALAQQVFFPILKYVITEALPLSLMGSALASSRSILEPARTGSVGHGGSFSQFLTEATPVAPLLPKPCHANPIQEQN